MCRMFVQTFAVRIVGIATLLMIVVSIYFSYSIYMFLQSLCSPLAHSECVGLVEFFCDICYIVTVVELTEVIF